MKMPVLRKLNAGLGLITTLVLCLHISFAYRALDGLDNAFTQSLPGVAVWFLMLHIVVAILTLVLTKSRKKQNKPSLETLLSRISGVLMLIPLFLVHTRIYADPAMHTPLFGLVEILFCALVTTHIATTVPKTLITLRMVRTTKSAYLFTLIARVVSALILLDCVLLIAKHIIP